MAVYLLHIDGDYRARHYCGSTADGRLDARMAEHRRATRGLIGEWNRRGLAFVVARTWKRWGRFAEERLKAASRLSRFCPRCTRTPKCAFGLKHQDGREFARRAARHGRSKPTAVIRWAMRRDTRKGAA